MRHQPAVRHYAFTTLLWAYKNSRSFFIPSSPEVAVASKCGQWLQRRHGYTSAMSGSIALAAAVSALPRRGIACLLTRARTAPAQANNALLARAARRP